MAFCDNLFRVAATLRVPNSIWNAKNMQINTQTCNVISGGALIGKQMERACRSHAANLHLLTQFMNNAALIDRPKSTQGAWRAAIIWGNESPVHIKANDHLRFECERVFCLYASVCVSPSLSLSLSLLSACGAEAKSLLLWSSLCVLCASRPDSLIQNAEIETRWPGLCGLTILPT